MNRHFFTSAALGIVAVTLTACGGETQPVEQTPDGIPGLEIGNARMVLNAVSGNPAAIYMDIAYKGERPIMVRRFDVLDAERTELHGYKDMASGREMVEATPFNVEDGQTVKLEPGERHVMAFDVSPDLKPGDSTEVTLTVAGGDKVSVPLPVRAAGEER